jgi:OmpA-OmpF porin, OOP family
VNIGYPINTEKDEGSMFITPDYSKAYMDIYNYQGRYSTCFIYEFEFPEMLKSNHKCTYAKGIVFDSETNDVLQAQVKLIDLESGEVIQEVSSSSKSGEFLIVLNEDKRYAFQVVKDGYLFYSKSIDFSLVHQPAIVFSIGLIPLFGKDQGVVLENIYFAPREFELLDASEVELSTLVSLLEENDGLKIVIEGYTDNVGDEAYNLELSQKRAQSVVDHLVKNGIKKSQLSAKGYGETKPRDTNETELGRANNRRIEIKIQ